MIVNDVSEQSNYPIVSSNIPPTVSVLACGGAGINMLRRSLPNITGRVTIGRLDAGDANIQFGEDLHIVGSGGGSGLVRKHNADAAVKTIAGLSDEALGISDINIVIFSLSGGSGSVIGPLLINDLANRRKKLVIALTIASTQSETHTKNTLATLQSLRQVTKNSGLYLPISIFSNTISGPKAVDTAFTYKLSRLVDLLTAPTIEVDKYDRLHWINVPKTIGEPLTGLRLLYVTTAGDNKEYSNTEVWSDAPGHIYDSLLALGTESFSITDRPRARVSFEGVFSTIKLVPMYGVIGNTPNVFDDFVRVINDTLNDYKTNAESHDDPFDTDRNVHKSGIIV